MPSKSSDNRPKAPLGLTLAALGTLLFLHVPMWIIFLYTLTPDETTYTFPLPGFTTKWFGVALQRADLWRSLTLSMQVAAIATLAALILGTLAAAAVYRSNFLAANPSLFFWCCRLPCLVSLPASPCALPSAVWTSPSRFGRSSSATRHFASL